MSKYQEEEYNNYGHINVLKARENELTLKRCGFDLNTTFTYNHDAPTLVSSLFMRNHYINDDKQNEIYKWTKRYLHTLLVQICIFKYYFPNGNVRLYLDDYMMNEYYDKIDASQLNMSDIVWEYYDYEKDKETIMRTYLDNKMKELKKIDTYKYNNCKEKLVDCLLRCDKDCFMLIYSFSKNSVFREKTGGYITDGYIGNIIRYIIMRQSDYKYHDREIQRPKHILYRDSHRCAIGYNDYLTIDRLNKTANKVFIINHSNLYERQWHGIIKCSDLYIPKSPYAGTLQFINKTKDKYIIDDKAYKRTIGRCFDNTNMNITHKYGKDELVMSDFFVIDYFRKHSVYFELLNLDHIRSGVSSDRAVAMVMCLYKLIEHICDTNEEMKIYKNQKYVPVEIVLRNIDILRTNKDNDANMNKYLRIFPSKYHIYTCLYSNKEHHDINFDMDVMKQKIHRFINNSVDCRYTELENNLNVCGVDYKTNTCKRISIGAINTLEDFDKLVHNIERHKGNNYIWIYIVILTILGVFIIYSVLL